MSHSSKKPPKDSLSVDSLRQALNEKPDSRKHKAASSPVSPLHKQASTTTTTSTSSSSGGSRTPQKNAQKSRTGSSSGESSPRTGNSAKPVVNVLPAGNICPSGNIKVGMFKPCNPRSDVLGSGTCDYGHGSIMCGSRSSGGGNAEELRRRGNEQFKNANYAEALKWYDKAVVLDKGNAAYLSNRASALIVLGKLGDAVRDYEEALKSNPSYSRANLRLGSLYVRLGQIECARKHFCIPGHLPDPTEIQKLQLIEKHLSKCADARKVGNWIGALGEIEAAIAAGADCCPQLFMFRTETLLKLHQLENAESSLLSVPWLEPYPNSCSQTEFFGMLSEAYLYFVRAQVEMAMGRFDSAVTFAQKAVQIDTRNVDIALLSKNVKLVARARARGNDLFKSERFTEACTAYDEGLRLDPSNPVLYCNRAACYFKLGQWERSINDSNQALRIRPNYMKALSRRAACNNKLERWEDAVKDYEKLRRVWPRDNEIAEALLHAQVELKKFRGEEVYSKKSGGDVEKIFSLDQYKAAISLQGVSVVYFKAASDLHCKQISPFVDTLCGRYTSVNFLQVDTKESPAVADNENVRIVPTFKIYINGNRVKEMICPSHDMLEHSVRHYST